MTLKKTRIIYVSGLGDRYDPIRSFCLWFWRIHGVETELVPAKWRNHESFAAKMGRVKHAVDEAKIEARTIVLVGESAGGSLAINAYADMPDSITRVVTLCGKNANSRNVSPKIYRRNPAFWDSMQLVGLAAERLTQGQRRRVTSIHPLYDNTVSIADTLIPDCRSVTLKFVGHIPSILFALTIASFIVVREARRPV